MPKKRENIIAHLRLQPKTPEQIARIVGLPALKKNGPDWYILSAIEWWMDKEIERNKLPNVVKGKGCAYRLVRR